MSITKERLAELIDRLESDKLWLEGRKQLVLHSDRDTLAALLELREAQPKAAAVDKLQGMAREWDVRIIHRADIRVLDGAGVFTITSGGKRYSGPTIPAALEAMEVKR